MKRTSGVSSKQSPAVTTANSSKGEYAAYNDDDMGNNQNQIVVSDMATALDHVLNDPKTEMKFQALKILHARKLKSLMGTIETQKTEIAKVKTLNKDNRRTQIIQSLKKKLREQEFVCDVLKNELAKKVEWSAIEVNDFVIKKTISGPKRFRPLTREELENKIADLEMRNKVKPIVASQAIASYKTKVNGEEVVQPRQGMKSGGVGGSRGVSRYDEEEKGGEPDADRNNLLKISNLMDEISSLKDEIDIRDRELLQHRDDITRLRAKLSELQSVDEEIETTEKNFRDISVKYDRLLEDHEDVLQRLAESSEECAQLKATLDIESEQKSLEIETLQNQCETSLKQNAELLKQIAIFESQFDSSTFALNRSPSSRPVTRGGEESSSTVSQLKEKLKEAQAKISALEGQLQSTQASNKAEIDRLVNLLREKNNAIDEQSRTIREQKRIIDNHRRGQEETGPRPRTSSPINVYSSQAKSTMDSSSNYSHSQQSRPKTAGAESKDRDSKVVSKSSGAVSSESKTSATATSTSTTSTSRKEMKPLGRQLTSYNNDDEDDDDLRGINLS